MSEFTLLAALVRPYHRATRKEVEVLAPPAVWEASP